MNDFRLSDRVIGRHRQRNTVATAASLRFWGRSMGERNPRFVDPTYRTATGAPGLCAHPCWLYSVHDTVLPTSHPDRHPLIAGTSWSFSRLLVPGDRVTFTARLLDEWRGQGRHAGETVWQQVEFRYHTPAEETLATAVTTLALVVPAAARDSRKYAAWQRYRYAAEELDRVGQAHDAETIRGAEPFGAEDVALGDLLPGIVRGPLTSEEMIQFVGATRPMPSLSVFAEALRANPEAGFFHPVTSSYESYASGFVDDFGARQLGFPAAHDYGIDRISQLASLVTNWLGDTGRLTRLDARLREPHTFGDTSWCSGRVVSVVGETIGLELELRNQRGQLSVSASAEAVLPRLGGLAGRGRA